ARWEGHMAEAGLEGSDQVAEIQVDGGARKLEAQAVDEVRDPARARRDLADLGLARRSLPLTRMRPAHFHPAGAHPRDSRARENGVSLRPALAVGEDVEALRAGAKSVGMLLREVDENVAPTDLVGLAILPRDPGAAEDEEDLLLGALGMRGRGP